MLGARGEHPVFRGLDYQQRRGSAGADRNENLAPYWRRRRGSRKSRHRSVDEILGCSLLGAFFGPSFTAAVAFLFAWFDPRVIVNPFGRINYSSQPQELTFKLLGHLGCAFCEIEAGGS